MILEIRYTSHFKRDIKLAKKQGKNLDKLLMVIGILANKEVLADKYHNHELSGNYKGYWECHIEPDWLLIYEINEELSILILYRLGSHSELFW